MFAEGKLIANLALNVNRPKSLSKLLEPFQGEVFETDLKGNSGQGV